MTGALFEAEADRSRLRAESGNPLSTEAEQLIHIPGRTPEENLMIGLIKEFANLQNVTQITACLPIPRAVGESVPRGILTRNLSSEEHEIDTTKCKQVPAVGWVQPAELYVQLILNATRGCRNQTKREMVLWDSVWPMTTLSQLRYTANASCCFTWDGNRFSTFPVTDKESTSREKEIVVSWWNCKKIHHCSTVSRAVQDIPPLAAALKYGCWRRALKNDLQPTDT